MPRGATKVSAGACELGQGQRAECGDFEARAALSVPWGRCLPSTGSSGSRRENLLRMRKPLLHESGARSQPVLPQHSTLCPRADGRSLFRTDGNVNLPCVEF